MRYRQTDWPTDGRSGLHSSLLSFNLSRIRYKKTWTRCLGLLDLVLTLLSESLLTDPGNRNLLLKEGCKENGDHRLPRKLPSFCVVLADFSHQWEKNVPRGYNTSRGHGRVGIGGNSDVWQGTSETSHDVPAVKLENLTGLTVFWAWTCVLKKIWKKGRK